MKEEKAISRTRIFLNQPKKKQEEKESLVRFTKYGKVYKKTDKEELNV